MKIRIKPDIIVSRLTYIKTCAYCREKFELSIESEWAYRSGTQYNSRDKLFCSWHCLQAWRGEGNGRDGRVSKTLERDREIYRQYIAGQPYDELAKRFGLSECTIRQSIRRIKDREEMEDVTA